MVRSHSVPRKDQMDNRDSFAILRAVAWGLVCLLLSGATTLRAQEPLAAFDPNVWMREFPADFVFTDPPEFGILPGVDYVATASNLEEQVAIRFFSGTTARWSYHNEQPPEWVRQVQSLPHYEGWDRFDIQAITADGRVVLFFYGELAEIPFKETSLGFRKDAFIDMPDQCKDPAADWMEVRTGAKVERKVLVFRFDHPVPPPNGGPCNWDAMNFKPPYDHIRMIIPRLEGLLLSDKTLLVVGASYTAMPVVLRMRPDLTSPAIDHSHIFLVEKEKIDDIRRAAITEFQAGKMRGEYGHNAFAPFAALVEARVLDFISKSH
jgi:hypothetical protein